MTNVDLDSAQLNWQQSVEQAVQDIRLVVDRANDLLREASDAERATAATQYHVFHDGTDGDELSRAARNLELEVGSQAARIRDVIADVIRDVADLGELARGHQLSL